MFYTTYAAKMRDERKLGWREGLEQGMEKGRTEGAFETKVNSVRTLAAKTGMTLEAAMDALDIPDDEREKIKKALSV